MTSAIASSGNSWTICCTRAVSRSITGATLCETSPLRVMLFCTATTPVTRRAIWRARSISEASLTAPDKVTTPDSTDTLVGSSPSSSL